MRTKIILTSIILALTTSLGIAASDSSEQESVKKSLDSDSSQRTRMDVTVYNQNLALVREIRQLDLPEGIFKLEFRDVPALINPASLLVEDKGRTGFTVLEQNYEFDLLSRQKIMEKYVGRDISWIQEDGSRINGKLLGMNDGAVYLVNDEIVFKVPGRISLPTLPENLRARPTLVWEAETQRGGKSSFDVSYLTGGVKWNADYVLQLDAEGKYGDLQAWVTVENRSGTAFPEANLQLVAGDVNLVRNQQVMPVAYDMESAKFSAGRGFQEETMYDYHMYTLQRPTTILDQQIKQLSLFESEKVAVQKHYRLTSSSHLYRGGGRLNQTGQIQVSYSFKNDKENELGIALPAGTFRVYGRAVSGSRQLLGEDRIRHTPRNEEVELVVGKAFDIVSERVRTESRKIADNVYRSTFSINIRNHRDEIVVVEMVEAVGGYWEIIESSHKHRKISASELGFDISVPADGETTVNYTVEVKF